MTRHHGRFVSPDTFADAPLLRVRAKCPRVSRGNRTRARRQRERVLAVAATLRAEVAARVEWF
jgi:hypothetical protein